MQGIAKIKPERGVTLKEFPDPIPSEKELLIKVKISGICGSDVSLYKLQRFSPDRYLTLPIIIGHEFCGIVQSVGSAVTQFKKGDRVAGETHIPCTTCLTCRQGNAHICPNQKNVGRTVNGSFAEYIVLPEVSVRRVPEGLTDYEVAMLEPLGVAVHAAKEKHLAGENVLVLGCGPIGLMTVAVAKALGASHVLATDIRSEKLEKAQKMGADQVFQASDADVVERLQKAAGSEGISVAVDMSGNEGAILQGLKALNPGGSMILAGIPDEEIHFDVLSFSIYKEIKLLGIFGRRLWESWTIGESLLEARKINVQPLIGSTYSPMEYERAFGEALSGKFGRTFIGFSSL